MTESESFEIGFGNWTSSGDLGWTRHTGHTPSGPHSTGPTSAHDGSWYIYTEASGDGCPYKTSYLTYSGGLVSKGRVDFWYNKHGYTCGPLEFHAYHSGGWHTIWSVPAGDEGDVWTNIVAYFPDGTTNVRFKSTTGSNWRGDTALDLIKLYRAANYFNIDGTQNTDVIESTILDTIAGAKKFELILAGTDKFGVYNHYDDVLIGMGDIDIFRGRIESIIPDYDTDRLIIAGRDYLGELLEQNIVEAYTNRLRSYIVDDLVNKYGTSLTRTHIDASPVGSELDYTFKTTSWDALLKCANEDGYRFWVDVEKDFHYHLRSYQSSGLTLIMGTDDIISFNIEEAAYDVVNKVTVYGKITGASQVAVMVEDLDSQSAYGLIKEKRLIDDKIDTEADAIIYAEAYLAEHAWVLDMITFKCFGYETLNAGETIQVTLPGYNIDGEYIVINKSHEFPSHITEIRVAKYAKHLEGIIANMIERLMLLERQFMEDNVIMTKIHRCYEHMEVPDRIHIEKKDTADAFLIGNDGHCVIGVTLIGDRRGAWETIHDTGAL